MFMGLKSIKIKKTFTLLLIQLCLLLLVPATVSLVQAETETVIRSGILDRDRVLGPRSIRVDFSPLESGTHTIRVTWDSDADIRFTLFQTSDEIVVARNITGTWTGPLSSSEQYYLNVWTVRGTANFQAVLESEAINPPQITGVIIGDGTLDSQRSVAPKFVRLDFDSLASAEHTIAVAWDSNAALRFNVLSANGERVNPVPVRGSNPGVWVGNLNANEQYYIGLWSVDGIANYTATVGANVSLAIQTQPSSLVVSEGMDAHFAVAASNGNGALNYQWYADGSPITGETSSTLTIFATLLAENGTDFSVDVSDGFETITSDVATLTVVEPATLGSYSQQADTTTWMLDGPAATLDYNVSNPNAAWGRVLLRIDDVLLVGGDYTGIRPNRGGPTTDRPWLAALHAVTGQPESSFQVPPEVDSVVRSLVLSPNGNEVYVGGDFGFLALDAVTGELNFSLSVTDGNSTGRVFDIAVTPSEIYIGGDFTHVANTFRKNIARLSLNGMLDGSWAPRVNGGYNNGREAPVQSVTVSPAGDVVYVGGNFRSIGDTAVPRSNQGTSVSMLAVDTNQSAMVRPERFTPNVVRNTGKAVKVRDIAVTDNYVIIAWGGPNYLTFHALDGSRLVQYQASGDVQALHLVGNVVFVGHHGEYFGDIESPIPPQSVQSIVPEIIRPFKLHSFRIDDPTFLPEQAWQASGFFGVWGISVAEDSIWITGQIILAGSNAREVDGLVRFPATQ